jgi:hypothetical protein
MATSPLSKKPVINLVSTPAKPTPTQISRSKGIRVEFVDKQRYDTCGDWFFDKEGVLVIRATNFEDIKMSLAIAFHEFVEATSCIVEGITPEQVDEFDMGQGMDYDEPGRHPSAPYHRQHMCAMALERKYTQVLGLDWEAYNKVVDDKPKEK